MYSSYMKGPKSNTNPTAMSGPRNLIFVSKYTSKKACWYPREELISGVRTGKNRVNLGYFVMPENKKMFANDVGVYKEPA